MLHFWTFKKLNPRNWIFCRDTHWFCSKSDISWVIQRKWQEKLVNERAPNYYQVRVNFKMRERKNRSIKTKTMSWSRLSNSFFWFWTKWFRLVQSSKPEQLKEFLLVLELQSQDSMKVWAADGRWRRLMSQHINSLENM